MEADLAEITRKRSGELIRGVFQILAGEPEGLAVKDVLRRLEELVPPTPFTRDAEQEARRQEKRRIMLLDSNRLFDLWVEHYDRVPEDKRGLLPLRPVHYLALGDSPRPG
jgi:hypothetical protein